MLLELLQNVALLVALSVGLQLLAQRINRPGWLYALAAGVLFGGVGVVAMMTPLHFAPGVIYDGRSIIISLAGFIGGPVTAAVAATICIAYRLHLGGAGAIVGVLVIIESALFGVIFYYLRRRNPRWEHPFWLWLFGLVVQSTMLLLQLLLPERLGWEALIIISPSVLLLYPVGFMVAALVFLENERRRALEKMVTAHNRILEMIASRVPLAAILDALLHEIVAQAPGMYASVLLLDEERQQLQHIAIAGLSAEYCAAVDAALAAASDQAIYAAATQRRRISTRNIATAPEWDALRRLALDHGLRAGWATPIFDPTASVLGVFALYYRKPAQPAAFHLRLIDQATHIAAIAITRHRQEEALRTERDFARQVMDSMSEGLAITDAQGRLTYVNPTLATLLGMQPEEMLGRFTVEFTVGEDMDIVAARIEQRRQGVRSAYDARLRHRDGHEIPALVSGAPYIRKGQFQGTIAVIADLSARNRAEQALRESEERYRLLVDTSPYAIGIYQDGKIVFANRAAAQLIGVDEPSALIGMTVEQIVAPDELMQTRARLEHLLRGETGLYPAQNTYLRADGMRVPVEVVAVPFAFGGRPAVQVLVQDITERVRRQRELEAQAMLAQALSETTELEPLLERILEAGIHAVAAANKGSIALVDTDGALQICAVHGYNDPRTRVLRFSQDFGYGARALRLRQPLLIADVRSDPEIAYEGEVEEAASVQSAIAVPLVVRGQAIGVMSIDNTQRKDAFNDHDLSAVVNIAATASLVLDRAQLFEEIEVQARQLAQIMETAPQGLILISAAGRVLRANPLGARDLAILAGVSVGDTITHLGDQPLAALLTIPPTGPWHEVHAGDRIFEIIARPVSGGSAPAQWVVVIDDVTRSRQIQAQTQLQERLATVGQLAAGIAHDFNNILNIIVLQAQMAALLPELPPDERQRMEVIVDQAQNATNLIRQILDFGRQALLERQIVDLTALLDDQVRLLRRAFPESLTISIAQEGSPSGVIQVNADPTRLRQVIMNLAINARDAMPDGGAITFQLASITLTPEETPPVPGMTPGLWARLTVTDTGVGIPPEILPHIFDPFFTTKAPGKGTGLGLAQVHGIITQHAGFITVATGVGQGTTFTLYLPALPATAPALCPPPLDAAPPGGAQEHLLLVEDNAMLRLALMEMLESLHYSVAAVANGREALTYLRTPDAHVDLVLSDVVMPDMGGVALARALRAEGIPIPIILMSGHPLDEQTADLQSLGVAAWLPKPCPAERLAHTIAGVLMGLNKQMQ
ncbi:MAG TPA: PAS domain S-box protein [Chloroflexi bacterium]|nr:PAS domain S-box protein [Chloroflexota bacterium]